VDMKPTPKPLEYSFIFMSLKIIRCEHFYFLRHKVKKTWNSFGAKLILHRQFVPIKFHVYRSYIGPT
jgi:hypothetical protein